MEITASMVKDLRERTGAGMMECKKALTENSGDIEAAIDFLRKTGVVKAAKRSSKIAAEGVITLVAEKNNHKALMAEFNSETDFVARGDDFIEFANRIAQAALENDAADIEAMNNLTIDGKSVEDIRQGLIAKMGENIQLRRMILLESSGVVGSYLHNGRIGVLVALDKPELELAKEIAMHIAAMRPIAVSGDDIPEELVAREKEVFTAQAKESGKPDNIIEKMIGGRINKFLNENSLLGQPFVKDPEKTVGDLLKAHQAKVLSFMRYEVGEGIEKEESNFAEEVMEQLK
ncbi:MAG: translation elongation factor Ts [Gammaproteobacteria bacterium RIFOXYB2_FULL_38_6]|nr:MAG: translation elongation factor Ts [Gammaproteobacteria bacterium RIFOXYB2_FULL_38_6]